MSQKDIENKIQDLIDTKSGKTTEEQDDFTGVEISTEHEVDDGVETPYFVIEGKKVKVADFLAKGGKIKKGKDKMKKDDKDCDDKDKKDVKESIGTGGHQPDNMTGDTTSNLPNVPTNTIIDSLKDGEPTIRKMAMAKASARDALVKDLKKIAEALGLNADDETMAKVQEAYDASVLTKVSEAIDTYAEGMQEHNVKVVSGMVEQYEEKIDGIVSYVANKWLTENEIAVKQELKTEQVEKLASGLKTLLEQFNVEIPECKVDLVEKLQTELTEQEDMNDALIAENTELKQGQEKTKRVDILNEVCDGLSESEKDKVRRVVNDIPFESGDTYTKHVENVRETYFGEFVKKEPKEGVVTEETTEANANAVTEATTSGGGSDNLIAPEVALAMGSLAMNRDKN